MYTVHIIILSVYNIIYLMEKTNCYDYREWPGVTVYIMEFTPAV